MEAIDVQDQERIISTYIDIVRYIPIVTTPIYLEAIYCVFTWRKGFQLHYTVILTAHISGCFYEESYGFQLFRPLVFLPVVGIYADGILSMLGVHPFIQLFGMFFAIEINGAILTHITIYRLKIIIPMSFRYYYRLIQFGIFSIVFIYVSGVLSVMALFLLFEDQAEAKQYLNETLRPLPRVFWSDKYMVSSPKNHENVNKFLIFGGMFVGCYMALCIILPAICFYILHRTKNSLSDKVIKAQRAYLRTILLQVFVVVLCLIIPFCVFFSGLASNISNPMVIPATLIFAIGHGAASTLIHLLSNKPFRDTMKLQLAWVWCHLTCKKRNSRNKVRTLSSIIG